MILKAKTEEVCPIFVSENMDGGLESRLGFRLVAGL